jgi:Icc-related predicted phosphoesterase
LGTFFLDRNTVIIYNKHMRVNIISDLHLEFGDLELPGGDVLVISGDVCESRTLLKHKYDPLNFSDDHGHPKRVDRAQRFFIEEVTKYRRVIYVMGNHEHYHGKYHKTWHELITCMPDNVEVLEQQHLEIDGVLFLGGTLWTDCNKGNPMCIQVLKNGMNDYRAITYHDKVRNIYRKLTPQDTMETHLRTKEYFKTMLELNRDKQVVVCTHHAPSYMSVHEHYKHDTDMNGGYASDLSEFILDHENIRFWTHGHMHDPSDYMIGQCRVICNPRGYSGYESQVNRFDPTVGFDI